MVIKILYKKQKFNKFKLLYLKKNLKRWKSKINSNSLYLNASNYKFLANFLYKNGTQLCNERNIFGRCRTVQRYLQIDFWGWVCWLIDTIIDTYKEKDILKNSGNLEEHANGRHAC